MSTQTLNFLRAMKKSCRSTTMGYMDKHFWEDRWANNQIGFHQNIPNPFLVEYFNSFHLSANAHAFVPLCGKSKDVVWLAQHGCKVTGVELSALAVEQFFEELEVRPQVNACGVLQQYVWENIVIFQGSIFDLTCELLGSIDFVYDRAALIALPQKLRETYASHLRALTREAPQLLICYEYDQNSVEGPPFSVEEGDVRHLYESSFELHLLGRYEVVGGLKGKYFAHETAWKLSRK